MNRRRMVDLAVGVCVLVFVFPLYWALVSSLTPDVQLFGRARLIPRSFVLDHYLALFRDHDFITPVRNSVIVAGSTAILAVALGAPCAYALSRLAFRGRAMLLSGVFALSMIPQIAIVSPLYLALRFAGLINSYAGLVLPYLTFAMPLTIWILAGFFSQLPREVEEAALVDGASRVRTFVQIVLPLSWPALATAGLLTFLYSWNEFLFALSFTLGPERQTVPVAVALFRGQYQVPWGEILAAAVVAVAPIAVLVLIAQRRIVAGLTSGAVKG